jgi:cell division protein FtsI (penicillin-binding protein 3)
MAEKKDIAWRVYLVYFGFMLMMAVVFVKTIQIQFADNSKILSTTTIKDGEKIPTRIIKREPRRGEILDVNYTPLVTSVSFYEIHMDPTVAKQDLFDDSIADLSRGLAQICPEKTAYEWESYIRRGRLAKNRYLKIKSKASNDERRSLRALPIFNKGRMKGGLIDTDETITRKRPHNELLKRTLGYYQNQDGEELKVGIEGAYNVYLKGEEGEEIEQKISTGWKRTGQIVKDAVEGADVVMSIDKEIQEVAHSELQRQLEAHHAKNGCAIVMDVKTGFVKAIVNLSIAGDGGYYELYNHAIGTKEVPGSTFKLASLMAALEDGKISITDSVQAGSKYLFYNKALNEAHNANYGRITIKHAFELSSNVVSKVIHNAYKNHPIDFIKRLRMFGLSEPLGIELLGEPTPTLYSPGDKNWWGGSLAWMSVGYEVQQTPLQTLAFYNAVANNGKFVRPQFVKEIRRGAEIVKSYEPFVINPKICSDKTLKELQSCLEGVMLEGTGRRLTNSYFKIAGKTGTAEILNDDMRYGSKGEKKYLASFVGYFPVEDPIYSCIVSISASGENIYGASVSGTVFSAIANKVYATSLQYHKAINESKKLQEQAPISKDGNKQDLITILRTFKIPYQKGVASEWINTISGDSKINLKDRKIQKGLVPNVIGMSAKDAVYLLESEGIKVKVKGYGAVKSQSVGPGVLATKVDEIEIILE